MSAAAAEQSISINIRKMSLLDVGAVHAIESASFPTPWRRRTFASRLLLSDHRGYVAEAEGRVVGYILYRLHLGQVHLQKIAVAKQFRRRGIGARLMEFLFDQAKTAGIEAVYLEVRPSNVGAQDFYKRFRFTLDHIRENYYSDTGEAAQVLIRTVDLKQG
ncbi:MAG: ribosomal protein S18-alanine N-acetyltransferase [Planctomycetes bacterium]|nr:ribosomal protein S18-alanine N-acetyltransferase [Planctomycetota bacterium]